MYLCDLREKLVSRGFKRAHIDALFALIDPDYRYPVPHAIEWDAIGYEENKAVDLVDAIARLAPDWSSASEAASRR